MQRHDLITLKPDAQPQSVGCCTTDKATNAVHEWIAAGRPLVCARQSPESLFLRLGAAIIVDGTKHRVSVMAHPQDARFVEAPHPLRDCLSRFSSGDAAILRRLDDDLRVSGHQLRVFGSVAWELISGQSYRTGDSDLDLLCDVRCLSDLEIVTRALHLAEGRLSFRLDGELRFPDGCAVNWREVATALAYVETQGVLVKSRNGIHMATLEQLLEPVHA